MKINLNDDFYLSLFLICRDIFADFCLKNEWTFTFKSQGPILPRYSDLLYPYVSTANYFVGWTYDIVDALLFRNLMCKCILNLMKMWFRDARYYYVWRLYFILIILVQSDYQIYLSGVRMMLFFYHNIQQIGQLNFSYHIYFKFSRIHIPYFSTKIITTSYPRLFSFFLLWRKRRNEYWGSHTNWGWQGWHFLVIYS